MLHSARYVRSKFNGLDSMELSIDPKPLSYKEVQKLSSQELAYLLHKRFLVIDFCRPFADAFHALNQAWRQYFLIRDDEELAGTVREAKLERARRRILDTFFSSTPE